MRFKLDECVDVRPARLFEDAGHDAETVFSEKLAGAADKSLYDICLKEKRTFVTQDLDFSNPFVFDPLPTKGIVVLRNPSQLLNDLEGLVKEMISILPKESPAGHLWVVTKSRIRIWPAE
jgi:predicted nuclease of predicted toxin-antitoxin system